MKNKYLFLLVSFILPLSFVFTQERIVTVDFESGSFFNDPKIPFDESFIIQGEISRDVEYVRVEISYEGKDFPLHEFNWSRIEQNKSDNFKIVVPPILRSNTAYDVKIITYKKLASAQKTELLENLRDRVRFLLHNNIYYDGKSVAINNPKSVYQKIDNLVSDAFKYQASKNGISLDAPSKLVLDELQKQNEFKFKRVFRKSKNEEKNDFAEELVSQKVNHITDLIISEVVPFMNSELVQHFRMVEVKSVETDKEKFSLPVNVGVYAWSKSANINDVSVNNLNFTPGAGFVIPFSNKGRLASQTRLLDSFGFSMGVLFQPVRDANETSFVTPGVNLPVYAGLGLRMFKVLRLNGGVIVLGEKGIQDFNNLSIIPTVGLALELNVWMGIKK